MVQKGIGHMKQNYDVAAYIWPAYTGDEKKTRIFWEKGFGEWQTVMAAEPKFHGHAWPRRPLWGYVNEANPDIMEMQIRAACRYGVNTFIYDWYWYDNRPYLENCLTDGFLQAENNQEISFYLMWANHDVNYLWDKRNADHVSDILYRGTHSAYEFQCATQYVIERYFSLPNYYRIAGKPVFCIYELSNLLLGLGGPDKVKKALENFRERCLRAGLPGVNIQTTLRGRIKTNLSGVDNPVFFDTLKMAVDLGFDSLTHYQYVHFIDIDTDYEKIIPRVAEVWNYVAEHSKIPYYPHVSIGWDNNPRHHGLKPGILKNNPPEIVKQAFQEAKKFVDAGKTNVPLITVNSWNEWTEGSYLEPDDLYGYGYLEAVRDTFLQGIYGSGYGRAFEPR